MEAREQLKEAEKKLAAIERAGQALALARAEAEAARVKYETLHREIVAIASEG